MIAEVTRDAGHRHRELMARKGREQTAAVSDIGEIPPVVDTERREACRLDLHRFLRVYFPNSTGLKPFSVDHARMIERIQSCALNGGLFGNFFPRGYAKSSIGEGAAIWATLHGHRRFVPIFGADAPAAERSIESIKLELAENDLLYDDFPEVCHAIRALEWKTQRCPGQTYHGAHTHIEWRSDTIVLPTIEGSVASGAILTAHGLTSGTRGMKHKRADGTQQRPDFIILDDPQTDESASSPVQIENRLSLIRKTILKLGGHNRPIACVMNATVIQPGDVADQICDKRKFPAWQVERVKMVKRWADAHETLWLGDYRRIRETFDDSVLGDQQRARRDATDFYRLNREAMDAGMQVSWEHCYDPEGELSAIQHAYNCLIDDGADVFASEYQNEPIVEQVGDPDALTAADLCAKMNRGKCGELPAAVTRVVAFIDPKKALFYWMVCGFDDRFGGCIVDYGTFPDQKRAYFTSKDARSTIQRKFPAMNFEAQMYAACDACVGGLMGREWPREDGAKLRIERILIDCSWGEFSDTGYLFCRQSAHSAVLMPSHGKYVGASSNSWGEFKPRPGDRTGDHWRMPSVSGKRQVRYVFFDTNWWKSFVASRIRAPMGGPGCLTLFGDPGDREDVRGHQLLVDHLLAEKPHTITDEKKRRTVVEWKHENTAVDNDYFDDLVGCHVAASIQGASLHERAVRRVGRVSIAELKRHAKTWDAKQKKWVERR